MTISKRIEKLEQGSAGNLFLTVFQEADGSFTDQAGNKYTQEELDHLPGLEYPLVLIWDIPVWTNGERL